MSRGFRAALAALVVMLCVPGAVLALGRQHRHSVHGWPPIAIEVLSGRADLVTAGSSLLAIDVPSSASRHLTITVDHHKITQDFAWRYDGRFEGLVTGLHLGRNILSAVFPNGSGARITLTNHPNGGPLFSGPQLEPWQCEAGAIDAQCDTNGPSFSYEYWSTKKKAFESYNPASPPSDVAKTTTANGTTLPFIIRIETGYEDRNQYKIAALYQPGKPWDVFDPQQQWNHKLLLLHGASCGEDYGAWGAPDPTNQGLSLEGIPAGADVASYALGQGFVTASTALDNSGHDCNVAVQAESLVELKEHIVKSYGTLRYTIGEGCSGGSLAIQWVSNAYPGIYQGILPTCSFPDAMTAATQVMDYALLERYWLQLGANTARGALWSPTQFAAVEGNALPLDAIVSVGCTNANPPYTPQSCPTGYFYAAVPYFPCPHLPAAEEYNPQTNPAGDRCSIIDLNKNLLGLRPPSVWSANEKKIGHGFTGLPLDNVGVEYGLGALQQGEITPAQFADLNAYIGGATIDLYPTSNRLTADEPALANSYRTGLVNETNNLNQTAIIDCRGPDPGAAHDAFRAFAIRARLDQEDGGHGNQLIWEGPEPLIADQRCEINAFDAMNRWLSAVAADSSSAPVAEKLITDKPADLSDRCYSGTGQLLWDSLCGSTVVPVYGTPRMVAGESITTDAQKCQLKPLTRSDITWTVAGITTPVPFSAGEWAELQKAFPSGVCDFTKPGVDQQPTIPWLTYQTAGGSVIYGGRPMGPPPTSSSIAPNRPKPRH